MKPADQVLQILKTCTGPSRHVDFQIAQHIGWKEHTKPLSRGGDNKAVWLDPETKEPRKVPVFTRDVQQAFLLLRYLAPDSAGAATTSNGVARVVIDELGEVEAPTLALAMCQAALLILSKLQSNESQTGLEIPKN